MPPEKITSVIRRHLLIAPLFGLVAGCASKYPRSTSAASLNVAIVGGGVGALTTAKYLLALVPNVSISVFCPDKQYNACFKSNEVLSDMRGIDSLQFEYSNWKNRVHWIPEKASQIDVGMVETRESGIRKFDVVVVATGIEFLPERIDGYNTSSTTLFPHAWRGRDQLLLLKQQLREMKKGGVFVISVPKGLFRCPPAPYERASLVAHYLSKHNPTAKVLILDSQTSFSKQESFVAIWKRLYGFGTSQAMIERIPGDRGGSVVALNNNDRTVQLASGERIRGDVINIIPPQSASSILSSAGLTNESGWAPVDTNTMETQQGADVYVVGDASLMTPMPKSAFSAASQARVCAYSIAAKHQGIVPGQARYLNVCFSYVAEQQAISIVNHFEHQNSPMKLNLTSGIITPSNASFNEMKREADNGDDWYNHFTNLMFS